MPRDFLVGVKCHTSFLIFDSYCYPSFWAYATNGSQ